MESNEKCKKIFRILSVSIIVYLIFRYLVPLVIPFLFAAVTAILLKPSVYWISEHFHFFWRGKVRQVGVGIIGLFELFFLSMVMAGLIYCGGKQLIQQIHLLTEHIPSWIHQLDVRLTGICRYVEMIFFMKENTMIDVAQGMIRNLTDTARQRVMPYLMENSISAIAVCIDIGVLLLVFVVGVILFLQEMDQWKERMCKSEFHEEFFRMGQLLSRCFYAYIRTQGLIMFLTACICTIGFYFLGNPYSILVGLGIGLLDALPILGAGTILIPWTVILLLQQKWKQALLMLGLYVLCYLVREFVETKMMGDKVGLSPLEMLFAIYVGLRLFGIIGVICGPVGLLLVKEFA